MKFVQEFVFEGFVKIIFVKTGDNDGDSFAKNLGGTLHEHHAGKMVVEKGSEE